MKYIGIPSGRHYEIHDSDIKKINPDTVSAAFKVEHGRQYIIECYMNSDFLDRRALYRVVAAKRSENNKRNKLLLL